MHERCGACYQLKMIRCAANNYLLIIQENNLKFYILKLDIRSSATN